MSSQQYYDMSHDKFCFILTNQAYESAKDENALANTWNARGYKIIVLRNESLQCTLNSIKQFLQSAEQHPVSCVHFYILTHGAQGQHLYIGGEWYDLQAFLNMIDVPALQEVPKIVIIQNNRQYKNKFAYLAATVMGLLRNRNLSETTVIYDNTPCGLHEPKYKSPKNIPLDIMLMHSDTVGINHVSVDGSPLIQELCKRVNEDRDEEATELFRSVALAVYHNYP